MVLPLTGMSDPSEETRLALMANDIEQMKVSLQQHRASHAELVLAVNRLNESWNMATGTLRFLKWISVVGAGIAAILTSWRVFHPHIGP